MAPSHPNVLQRDFAVAVRAAGLGHDIRTIQELLGHRDVATTLIYTRGARLTRDGRPLRSPLDDKVEPTPRGPKDSGE
jgi:integrase